jgi:hypothetical protein
MLAYRLRLAKDLSGAVLAHLSTEIRTVTREAEIVRQRQREQEDVRAVAQR